MLCMKIPNLTSTERYRTIRHSDNIVSIRELLDEVRPEMAITWKALREEAENDSKRIPLADNKVKCIMNMACR